MTEAQLTDVSRETLDARLEAFHTTFTQWSRRMNLTSASERGNLDERHIADSLQLLDLVPSLSADLSWVDIGTGGGFPGAILAAALPSGAVTMVESNNRKAAFLRAACLGMGVRSSVLPERAEVVVPRLSPPSVVSARAVASLSDLLDTLHPWLRAGTLGLFPKGRTAEAEITAAHERHDFDVVRHPSAVADDSCVLAVTMGGR